MSRWKAYKTGNALEKERKDALKIAEQFGFSSETKGRIELATSIPEIFRILKSARLGTI